MVTILSTPTAATVHQNFASQTDTQLRAVRDVLNKITRIYPAETPFFTLMNKTLVVDGMFNRTKEWYYFTEFPRTVTINATATAAAVSLTVVSSAHIKVGQTLLDLTTREQLRVITVTSNTAIVVATRGTVGGGTPGAFAVGKELIVLQHAVEEGATAIGTIGAIPAKDYNYAQQFEVCKGITDIAKEMQFYGGVSQYQLDDEEVMAEYKKRSERQFLYGQRDKIAAGDSGATTNDVYVMGGLLFYIIDYDDNVFDAGGAFTYAELCSYMNHICRFGSKRKLAMGGQQVRAIMNQWSLSHYQADFGPKNDFGIDITTYRGPGWTLDFVPNEQMETDLAAEWLFIVDMPYLRHHVFRNLGDKTNYNITGPKTDGSHTIKDQITGVHTLVVNNAAAHGIITGIRS